jgi:hypothetical protein
MKLRLTHKNKTERLYSALSAIVVSTALGPITHQFLTRIIMASEVNPSNL